MESPFRSEPFTSHAVLVQSRGDFGFFFLGMLAQYGSEKYQSDRRPDRKIHHALTWIVRASDLDRTLITVTRKIDPTLHDGLFLFVFGVKDSST
jgi:hypothetical protein